MPPISKQNSAELQRIIKESTGRNTSPDDAQMIWRFIIKLLNVLRGMEYRRMMPRQSNQQSLFEKSHTDRKN